MTASRDDEAPSAEQIAALVAHPGSMRPTDGGGYQSCVRLYPEHDPPLVIKGPLPGVRRLPSLWMIRREHRIYQRLAGIPGIPRCYGLYRGEWLVLEHIRGRELRRRYLDPAPPSGPSPAIEGLRETIAGMHRRGIAHTDLKRRTNLILTAEQRIYIIDFGTALIRKPGSRPGPLWRWAAQQDWNAWARHGWGDDPAAMPPSVQRLHRRTGIERWAKRIRRLYR